MTAVSGVVRGSRRTQRTFYAAVATTFVGDGIRYAAVALLAVSLTPDAFEVALVAVAAGLPWLVLGVHAGALADRLDPLRLLVLGLVGQSVLAAALLLLLGTGQLTVVVLALLTFALQSVDVVTDVASNVLVPQIFAAGEVQHANSRLVTIEVLTLEISGPVLAGALFAVAPAAPFALDLASFVIGALLLALLGRRWSRHRPGRSRPVDAPAAHEGTGVLAGFAFVRRTASVRSATLLAAALNLGLGGLLAVQVLHLTRMGLSAPQIGAVVGLSSIGSVVAGVLAGRLTSPAARRMSCVLAVPLVVAGTVAFAVAGTVVAAALALALIGAAVTLASVALVTLRQHRTPPSVLGRVTAAVRVVCWGVLPVGAALAGLVGSWTSTGWSLTVLAGVVLVGAVAPAAHLLRQPMTAFVDASDGGPA